VNEAYAGPYAMRAHGKQKYGGNPYGFHLNQVVNVLHSAHVEDPTIIAAAWLHDTIEDTKITWHDLFAAFGPEVADLVWAVTGVGKSRIEQQESIRQKISGNWKATVLKLADRIANVEYAGLTQSKYRASYLAEREAFEKACKVSCPSSMIEGLLARLNNAYEACNDA
jgi:(p)ppGpp synthase/HD superfamily hydrolase